MGDLDLGAAPDLQRRESVESPAGSRRRSPRRDRLPVAAGGGLHSVSVPPSRPYFLSLSRSVELLNPKDFAAWARLPADSLSA